MTDQSKQLNNCVGCEKGLPLEDDCHYEKKETLMGHKFRDYHVCTKSNYEVEEKPLLESMSLSPEEEK